MKTLLEDTCAVLNRNHIESGIQDPGEGP